MKYDFETVVDRKGTYSLKWDNVHNQSGKPDILPLWVADMDFPVLPQVQRALQARVEHPVFGYTNLPQSYFQAVREWNLKRYARDLPIEVFLAAPTVMHAISMAIRTLTGVGDRILNLPPIYYPFYKVVSLNDRVLVEAPLKVEQGIWKMDEGSIEKLLIEARNEGKPIKALLMSAPHNPTGRVWTLDELRFVERIAHQYDLIVLSDEIHSDLVLPGYKHVSLSDLPGLHPRLLVFAGPNKTFNLAGLSISHVVAFDPTLKGKMARAIMADFFDQPNVLSLTAAWVAYREGSEWLDQLLLKIMGNWSALDAFLRQISKDLDLEQPIKLYPLEATYLAWADVSGLVRKKGFADDKELASVLEKDGRVKVSHGSLFQTGGTNHLRFNLATPTRLLLAGFDRIRKCLL